MASKSNTENVQASGEELQEALETTDRWLRKLVREIKDGPPEDEEGKERLATALRKARQQIRKNRELLGLGGGGEAA